MKSKVTTKTYSVDEVAAMSGFSRSSIYSAIKKNKVPFKVIRLLDSVRIEKTSCDKWLEQYENFDCEE